MAAPRKKHVETIPINPGCRYVILARGMDPATAQNTAKALNAWWTSGEPAILLSLPDGVDVEFKVCDDTREGLIDD